MTVVGRIRGLRSGWRESSKIQRVELQSVVMWHVMPWFVFLGWSLLPIGLNLRHDVVPQLVGWAALLTSAAQCVQVNRSLRRALDHYLGRGELPRRDLVTAGVLMTVALAFLVALEAVDGVHDGVMGFAVMFPLLAFGGTYCYVVSVRTFLVRMLAIDAGVLVAFAAIGAHPGRVLALACMLVLTVGMPLLMTRCGAWTLAVMWEADRARETEARLAVAEERLRFGRDLHDVMGRNLAVIALKSELAVQLARRGRPEAVDQMVEVQRIAQESQREVRDVVRGYREADLGAELAGAQGVLTAAGIECEVTGSAAGLPAGVQSALGWAVREAATNVLRHGDARRCAIALAVTETRTTLTVENDGVPEAPAADCAGSGLAGLKERLSAVDGTLEAGPAGAGRFRLTARVPLPEPAHRRQLITEGSAR